MSNNLRRLALFLLAASMIELTGCGLVVINRDKFSNDTTASPAISTEVSTQEPEDTVSAIERDYTDAINQNLASIPDKDYTGSVFKITSPDVSSLSPDENLEFLSETAEERNKLVEKKHSISIITSKVDYTILYEEVNAAVKSGMYYSDLLMLSQELVGSFAAGGLIMNMRSLPGFDFDATYLNQSSIGAAAGGFYSYAAAGYASIYPYSLPAVFFNRDLCTSAGVDPYNLVYSGDWTWDKFFETGIYASALEDTFSWGSSSLGGAVCESAFYSIGYKMINSGILTVPTLAFDADAAASADAVLKRLYSDEYSLKTNLDSISLFAEGKGLFQIEKLSAMTSLKDSKAQWGIIPLPKGGSAASYISLSGTDSLMFSCPATVSTPEKSAIILMSLNAASEGVIRDAYINFIQYNYLRDNESANMLEYIIDGAVYDFAYTFGGMYSAIADGTYNMIREAAESGESLDSLINGRITALDRVLQSNFGLAN